MNKFGVDATAFTSPTGVADTAISITMGAAEVAEIVELMMSGSGTTAPADVAHHAGGSFCDFTTAGTPGASPVPEAFNSAIAVAGAEADIEYTAEPTNINVVQPVSFGFNQRGGYRWSVPQGEGIRVIGGATEDGFVWTVVSSAAGAIDAAMHWWELQN